MKVTYRWVDAPDFPDPTNRATDEEWEAIDKVLQKYHWMSLNRQLTRVLLAEDEEGKMVGFSVIQLIPNLGPLHVEKSHRGMGVADELAAKTVEFMVQSKARGWIVVADSEHSVKLAEGQGMTKLQSPVYAMGMGGDGTVN